jgi:hypothetical protein
MPMAKLLTSRAFDPETTSLLGAAFDKAWQTVQTSGSPLAEEKRAAATREILAKKILAAGHRGERDGEPVGRGSTRSFDRLQRHISARHRYGRQ